MKEGKRVIIWSAVFAALLAWCLISASGSDSFTIFFDGWWTLFVIIPAADDIFRRGLKTANLVCAMSGAILFIAVQDFIRWESIGKFIVPVMVVIAGAGIIFSGLSAGADKTGRSVRPHPEDGVEGADAAGMVTTIDDREEAEVSAVFSSVKFESIRGAAVTYASCTSVFGHAVLDLSEADISGGLNMTVNVVFGSAEIILPPGTAAGTDGLLVIAGCSNSALVNEQADCHKADVEYNCVFGSVTVYCAAAAQCKGTNICK